MHVELKIKVTQMLVFFSLGYFTSGICRIYGLFISQDLPSVKTIKFPQSQILLSLTERE